MRIGLVLAAVAAVVGFGLGCGGTNLCAQSDCSPGLYCDSHDGLCKRYPDAGANGADAGRDGGSTSSCGSCSGPTPVCDPVQNICKACLPTNGCGGTSPICDTAANGGLGQCVTCTATQGCSGSTPHCLTSVAGGACVGCITARDCSLPGKCDPTTYTCRYPPDAGSFDAGFFDGGASWDGGVCIHPDAGPGNCPAGTECPHGFVCEAGQCVLNGANGAVQVTLRWDQPEDLDLHVLEPRPGGGSCEIWYGDPNNTGTADGGFGGSSCGAEGMLDLDSNAGCNIDNVDTENVIYPAGQPAPSGTYVVRVDYYENCFATGPVPYEVTVRANGTTTSYCAVFNPPIANGGAANSGVTITTFTVP